jgi:thioredoxin 1
MSAEITSLSDATFDETVQSSSEAVVVDFWAEWCGPCKMISPILEEIASEHKDKVRVVKLNVDDNPDVTRRYDVMSIPTLIVFKDGQAKKRLVGAKGKGQLLQELGEFL